MTRYSLLADDAHIEKPVIDDRQYRFIKLGDNDLHVLLISDPSADKAAAALDVNVGSFADKQYGISGLAHFCEHLLFMGTGKYPAENEYLSYLARHSGSSNAYTSSEHTNYYFQVDADHLKGALDRFAQFFIDPLFSQACKDREINAVDSENKKNLQQDLWRLYQLDKSYSNPRHPYNGFSTGNHTTLHVEPINAGKNVRDELLDFYASNYSANIMNLVILGKENLDILAAWAEEMFLAVPNKGLARATHDHELIYTPKEMRTITRARPIKDTHKLELSFLIPSDLDAHWLSRPASYYAHLLGHESAGSVLHAGKAHGWINELSCGSMRVCSDNTLFVLEFDLTLEGMRHWEEVARMVFQYLRLVRDQPEEWIWREVSNMSKINFRFKQKAEALTTVSGLASSLHRVVALAGNDKDGKQIPPAYALSTSINREFDPAAIKEVGSHLTADNVRVSLVSQTLDGLDRTEKWYGTQHSHEPLSAEFLESLKTVGENPALHLPTPNAFVPEDFTIHGAKSSSPLMHPHLIEDNTRMQVWYKQDDRFEVPKGSVDLVFHLPASNTDAKTSTMMHLYLEMLDDHLTPITYYASLVGLKARFSTWRDGLHLKVSGYNDKVPTLLTHVLRELERFVPDEARFEPIKQTLAQDYRNFGFNVPYQQIGTHFLQLVNEKTYTYLERLAALERVGYADLYEFVTRTLWSKGLFSEMLIHGNFTINTARDIKKQYASFAHTHDAIGDDYAAIEKCIRMRNHVLPAGARVRYEVPLADTLNVNSCIEYNIQISEDSSDDDLRVLTDLFGTVVREPCFDQLRTKEQLGYVVFLLVKLGRTTLGFRFLVQSERSTAYLEYRIDEFLAQFARYVRDEMTEEDFGKFKAAMRASKMQKLKHLGEEANRFMTAINDGYFDFEARQRHVRVLDTVTKAQFVAFVEEYILNDSDKTARLVVHLQAEHVPEVAEDKLVHCALTNYLFREGIEFVSDELDATVSAAATYDELAVAVAGLVRKSSEQPNGHSDDVHMNAAAGSDGLEKKLLSVIKEGIAHPVPSQYPTGKRYDSVSEFRRDYKLGGIPLRRAEFEEFYYPEDQSHL